MVEGSLFQPFVQNCHGTYNVKDQMTEKDQCNRPQPAPGQFPLAHKKAGIFI